MPSLTAALKYLPKRDYQKDRYDRPYKHKFLSLRSAIRSTTTTRIRTEFVSERPWSAIHSKKNRRKARS